MLTDEIISLIKKGISNSKKIFESLGSEDEAFELAKNSLIMSGAIIEIGNRLLTLKEANLYFGQMVALKDYYGFAKIVGEEEDGYVSLNGTADLLIGDYVYLKKEEGRRDSYTISMLYKREKKEIVGTVAAVGRDYHLAFSKSLGIKGTNFVISENVLKAVQGDLVRTEIIRFDNFEKAYKLRVVEIIGHENQVGLDIEKIILENDAPLNFPNSVIEEVLKFPKEVPSSDLKGREDYTNSIICTIDGADALDFDDAVEATVLENGNYRVGIHIADVSHYVLPKSALDEEALNRSFSLYTADRVVPMLPKELSNGLCSLNPDVIRLTLSCFITLDKGGKVLESEIKEGFIKSSARLTYQYVNDLLEGKEVPELDEKIVSMLKLLDKITKKVRKLREAKGCLNIESTEIKFFLDPDGIPLEIIKKEQGVGEKLIEDLMILANVAVATKLTESKIPTIYRVHEDPLTKKMTTFMAFSEKMGFKCDFDLNHVVPLDLQKHMSKVTNPDDLIILSSVMLRSLAKARYSPENLGHFGLAEKLYCHFTSPIRRYPDLIVHRTVKENLLHKKPFKLDSRLEYLDFVGETTSIRERRAVTIERAVDDLEAAKYMSSRIGESFKGYVNGISRNGMFIQLESGIEGMISYTSIDDNMTYIEDRSMAVGSITKCLFELGTKVEVICESVSVEGRQINLILKDLSSIGVFDGDLLTSLKRDDKRADNKKYDHKKQGGRKKEHGKSRQAHRK